MIWALIIGGVVLAAIFSSSLSKSKKEELAQNDFSERSELKIQSYVDYLRRTSENDEIKAMSEIELKDYISTAMREYNQTLNKLAPSNAPKYANIRFLPAIFWGGILSAGVLTAIVYEDVSAPIWLTISFSAIIGMVFGAFIWGVSKLLPVSGSKWGHDQYEKAIQELTAKIKEKGLDPERLKVEQ